mmetsp:Transcript_9985/g.26474  ORF Transcript_9985/g.26474 Transcript_9985/m.26474 type:complete len:215 (+) Transcript_9985:79-723(+)
MLLALEFGASLGEPWRPALCEGRLPPFHCGRVLQGTNLPPCQRLSSTFDSPSASGADSKRHSRSRVASGTLTRALPKRRRIGAIGNNFQGVACRQRDGAILTLRQQALPAVGSPHASEADPRRHRRGYLASGALACALPAQWRSGAIGNGLQGVRCRWRTRTNFAVRQQLPAAFDSPHARDADPSRHRRGHVASGDRARAVPKRQRTSAIRNGL